jgi:hypothetical protein
VFAAQIIFVSIHSDDDSTIVFFPGSKENGTGEVDSNWVAVKKMPTKCKITAQKSTRIW